MFFNLLGYNNSVTKKKKKQESSKIDEKELNAQRKDREAREWTNNLINGVFLLSNPQYFMMNNNPQICNTNNLNPIADEPLNYCMYNNDYLPNNILLQQNKDNNYLKNDEKIYSYMQYNNNDFNINVGKESQKNSYENIDYEKEYNILEKIKMMKINLYQKIIIFYLKKIRQSWKN